MSRPTKYSDDLSETIITALELGNTRKTSYMLAGISADTFAAWMKRFSAFSASVKAAEQKAIARNVGLIQQAAAKNWKAAAWFLERKDPDNWKQRTQLDVLDLRKLSEEDLDTVEEIAKRAAIASDDPD